MKEFSKLYKPGHSAKTNLFKVLDKLPHKVGFYFYHKIQALYKKQNLDYKIHSTKNSFRAIERILKKQNINLKNSRCVEMGSGWLPIFPYLLKLEGDVAGVDTYDINKHYNVKKIKELNEYFRLEYITKRLEFSGHYKLLDSIQYFPETTIEQAPLQNIDFIFSRFVLEHIPPDIIERIHEAFYHKLPPGAYILHLISPSDHRAYGDKSISLYDFLKYSKGEWNNIQTKFDYHNRLRLPQYLAILEKRFEIVCLEYTSCKKESPEFKKFKSLSVHEDYKDFTDEELTAGSINVLLKKRG
jgi:hypothetical protein